MFLYVLHRKLKLMLLKIIIFSVCFCVYCTRGDEGHITRDDMYALMRQALIHVSMLHIIYTRYSHSTNLITVSFK